MKRSHRGVTSRSSVLRGAMSHSPHLPQHDLTNESRASAASESSTSPVASFAILSWRGAEAQSVSLIHISRLAADQFWSSPKEWRLITYIRRYTSNTMSATIILGAQWGDEGKVRQVHPGPAQAGAIGSWLLEGLHPFTYRTVLLTTNSFPIG